MYNGVGVRSACCKLKFSKSERRDGFADPEAEGAIARSMLLLADNPANGCCEQLENQHQISMGTCCKCSSPASIHIYVVTRILS